MKKNLIRAISRDLDIESYEGEPSSCFKRRLIYSAIVSWIKIITLDTIMGDGEAKSKIYLHNRGAEILANYLSLFPECREYFLGEGHSGNPIALLRNRMLSCGELVEIDDNVSLGKESTIIYQKCLRYIGNINGKYKSVGVTKIEPVEKTDIYIDLFEDSEIIFDKICQGLAWELWNIDATMEVFNPTRYGANSNLWERLDKSKTTGLTLARTSGYNGSYIYYFIKNENGKYYISPMNTYLTESYEQRRFMNVLRAKRNNALVVNAVKYKNVVHLKLNSAIPSREQNILYTFAWPYRSIDDKYEYIVPIEIWSYIKKTLELLKLNVKEDIYGGV